MRKKSIILILIVMFFACSDKEGFQKYKRLKNQEWASEDTIKFDFFIKDTLSEYNLFFNLRHTVNYEYRNLFFFMHSEENRDTIEVMLSDKNGKWYGKGVGEIREIQTKLASKKYNKKGKHSIILEQAMRYGEKQKIDNLKNIDAVGVIIIKTDE